MEISRPWKVVLQIFGGTTMSRKQSKQFYSEIDQIADSQAFLDSVHEGFAGVEDPRAPDNQDYPLVSLLVIILCAMELCKNKCYI